MKTTELTGAQLDWAVGTANGETLNIGFINLTYTPKGKRSLYKYSPSTNWSQGGPIIEREKLVIAYEYGPCRWQAYLQGGGATHYGPTPLIAAMRCYVASKLGDDIDIPKELA